MTNNLAASAAAAPRRGPIIRRLFIERFRGIAALVWHPGPGVNVILGGGDIGKTTILEAIGLLLSPTNAGILSDTDYHTTVRTRESQIPAKGCAFYSPSELDSVLTTQLIIGWAGESGDDRRLGWWQSDLSSEFGGADLFARLVPDTWRWAVLQGAREAARRRDAELRAHDHDPDRLVTIYRLGFDVDERLDERLQDLKRSNADPATALPGLHSVVAAVWDRERFSDWVRRHGQTEFVNAPAGRRLKNAPPQSVVPLMEQLVAACWPLADNYPLPHFVKTP